MRRGRVLVEYSRGFCVHMNRPIIYDEAKRQTTLQERGLDFAEAGIVLAGRHFTRPDDRKDYGEPRFITAGWLRRRFVVLVWTPRPEGTRIISMRYGHADEEQRYNHHLD